MGPLRIIWDLDDDPEGNVQQIAEHGLTKEDVESVLRDPDARGLVIHPVCRRRSARL